MILYILALGSPTHPATATAVDYWTSGYQWRIHATGTDLRRSSRRSSATSTRTAGSTSASDPGRLHARAKGITYFENSRRATLAQRAYCIANPGDWSGYSDTLWGLTACDGPRGRYTVPARGAPPAQNDDGTITPTARGGSIAFAPEICIPTLRNMYDTYRARSGAATASGTPST